MEKFLAPADKVLTEIGRLVLLKPLFSGVLLISAIVITIFSNTYNKVWHTSSAEEATAVTATTIPLSLPAANSSAVNNLNTQAPLNPETDKSAAASAPNLAVATPASVSAPTSDVKAAATDAPVMSKWKILAIRRGDTLAKLFKHHGLSAKESLALSHLTDAKPLRHLKPGQEMRFYQNGKGQLEKLVYAASDKTTLSITRSGKTYKASMEAIPISSISISTGLPDATQVPNAEESPISTTKALAQEVSSKEASAQASGSNRPSLRYASGRISRSLSTDARKAGLSAKQVNQLVQIFSSKNIAQKLRTGDQFNVLYEAPTTAGSKKLTGNILAAQLVTNDKTYQLIRFTDPKHHTEYYTPQGESLKEGILRVPERFGHVSSGFSKSRLHPLLGFYRPHLGIDFDAPYGTPIRATGEGVLAEMGYKGGYGKAVMIQHGGKYSTLYGHMSRFASGVREGQRVSKGQIIGYVGQTGIASGPHLHYEIRVNNVPANPMTVALPKASIPKAYRNQFLMQTKTLLAQLNTNKHQIQLAQRSDPAKRS